MSKKAVVQKVEVQGQKGIAISLSEKPRINFKKRIKVLWYSDFLRHTGFGNVSEEIVDRLYATGNYEFMILGINHTGSPYNYPASEYFKFRNIPIWPAYGIGSNDGMMGYNRLARLIAEMEFDILFVLQDSFNLINMKESIREARRRKNFRYIFYFPIDGEIKQDWVDDAIKEADCPVTYTEYGKKKVQELSPSLNLKVIPHGVDLGVFRPFDNEEERLKFRQSYFMFPKKDEVFLITNVNRNQPRKDMIRCLLAFKEFYKKYPGIDARLYLHCIRNDHAGFDLPKFAKENLPFGLRNKLIFVPPEDFGDNGFPVDFLRKIYASSDVITSTTLGEGWGLCTTEAMACKTPVVMPDNTATTEIIGKGNKRGYLVKSGSHTGEFTMLKDGIDVLRPVTNIEDLISKWKHVYDNREEAKRKAEKAYKWLQDYTWDEVAKKWDELFQKQYSSLRR